MFGPNSGCLGPHDVAAAKRLLLNHAIDAGQAVCERWSELFGGIDRYNDARCNVMLRLLLDEDRRRDELTWAAEAYWRFVDGSDWHRKQSEIGVNAVQTFERFYTSDRLDQWIAQGQRLSREGKRAAETREALATARAADEAREARRVALHARFLALPAARQATLLEAAAAVVRQRSGYAVARPSMQTDLVATEVFRLMEQGAW